MSTSTDGRTLYPIADKVACPKGDTVMAIATDEVRPPRKFEWYLSGAVVEAYLARSDMATSHRIANLVEIESVTVYRIVRRLR